MEFAYSLAVPLSATLIYAFVKWRRSITPSEQHVMRSAAKVAAEYWVDRSIASNVEPMGDEQKARLISTQTKFAEAAIRLYINTSRARWW